MADLSKQPKKARTSVVISGIPGTFTHGFRELPIVELPLPESLYQRLRSVRLDPEEHNWRRYTMGPCSMIVGREPAGVKGELLWHLTISTPSRHPTWDEIKIARYRLLPEDLCFGIMLPPPGLYVNLPEQDHVFHLWEMNDPREPWSTG